MVIRNNPCPQRGSLLDRIVLRHHVIRAKIDLWSGSEHQRPGRGRIHQGPQQSRLLIRERPAWGFASCLWTWLLGVGGAILLLLQKRLQWQYFRRPADRGVTLWKQTLSSCYWNWRLPSFQSRKLGIFSMEDWEKRVLRISEGANLVMIKAF